MKARNIPILFCFLSVVYCQASTNPVGFPWFNPSNVREFPLNTNQTGTLSNQTGYQDFWYFVVPDNIGKVLFYLNNTNYGSNGCDSSVQVWCSESTEQESAGFVCPNEPYPCSSYGFMFEDSGQGTSDYDSVYGSSIYLYFTVTSDGPCSYSFGIFEGVTCPNETTPGAITAIQIECIDYQTVTSNGQTFAGTLQNTTDRLAYKVFVPQNVSHVWATLVTDIDILGLNVNDLADAAYTSAQITYNSTDQTYTYFYSVSQPFGDTDYYATVFVHNGYSISSPANFNITIEWSYCGSSSAGLGILSASSTSTKTDPVYPDCSDAVVQQLDIANRNSWSFQIPGYNSTSDLNYNALYAYFYPPFGTVGYLNFTCNSTDDMLNTFVVFTVGQMASCNNPYVNVLLTCPNQTSDTYTLLSQDLYPGRYWSVAICTSSTSDIMVTINAEGSVTVPAPSPVSTPSSSPNSHQSTACRIFSPFFMIIILLMLSM